MTDYEVKDSELESLRGKTILIIGAATGIGRATVLLAHSKDSLPLLADVLTCRCADILRLCHEQAMEQMLQLATGTMRKALCLQRV